MLLTEVEKSTYELRRMVNNQVNMLVRSTNIADTDLAILRKILKHTASTNILKEDTALEYIDTVNIIIERSVISDKIKKLLEMAKMEKLPEEYISVLGTLQNSKLSLETVCDKYITIDNDNVEEVKVEEPNVSLHPLEDKITMPDRKACPVKVKAVSPVKRIGDSNDESLNKFKAELETANVTYDSIKRVDTGLVELVINQNNGNQVLITVDIDSKILGNGKSIFWFNKINPLDEYKIKPFVFTMDVLHLIMNGEPIPENFYVPEEYFIINKIVDLTSLKKTNPEKRDKVLTKLAKIFSNFNEDIVKGADGKPFRFIFTDCKSENKFDLKSDEKVRVSNLSSETLRTDRQILISVKDDKVDIIYPPLSTK